MKKLALLGAGLALMFIGSSASACVVLQHSGNNSYLKNTCRTPVKLSVCSGKCNPRNPQANFPAGARKLIRSSRYKAVHYRWCRRV